MILVKRDKFDFITDLSHRTRHSFHIKSSNVNISVYWAHMGEHFGDNQKGGKPRTTEAQVGESNILYGLCIECVTRRE